MQNEPDMDWRGEKLAPLISYSNDEAGYANEDTAIPLDSIRCVRGSEPRVNATINQGYIVGQYIVL